MPDAVELHAGTATLSLVPARGAIITRWRVDGEDQLYLDQATLDDPTKNVRGGVPLLFPSPGKLVDDRFAHAGQTGAMKQHGFARDVAFRVVEQKADEVTLGITSTDATRAVFPWDFALQLRVLLVPSSVRLEVRVENPGTVALPFGVGIHPYFRVTDKAKAAISTAATLAYDNVAKANRPFHGFDLAHGETDLHLLDHGSTESTLTRAPARAVTVRTSQEFRRWVVWTLPGKDFVCLEPWTAPGNALNSGEGLITLMPGEARDLWIELALP